MAYSPIHGQNTMYPFGSGFSKAPIEGMATIKTNTANIDDIAILRSQLQSEKKTKNSMQIRVLGEVNIGCQIVKENKLVQHSALEPLFDWRESIIGLFT